MIDNYTVFATFHVESMCRF